LVFTAAGFKEILIMILSTADDDHSRKKKPEGATIKAIGASHGLDHQSCSGFADMISIEEIRSRPKWKR